ncbi:hypothetical protein ATJ88_0242 [Isoptericola jiangsuensis]|uniref:Uncharacterized protein n=1 Tax=Isoptericola jiangsuensis TaxID=548579 RepID=A0A2A9ETJ1_9MICO|nr:hypothetical protein [Isoptericola jiangsuensis]PFG41600.1 hypothetical protein ATJ88_0242 [Isoptericola jiangsuensis]
MTAPATGNSARRGTIAHVWSVVGGVVAPVTLVTAVLFYFGYVHTQAQLEYFGVDVDLLGLGTQDFVMRSPGVLLVPMLVLLLGGAVLLVADGVVRRRLATADAAAYRRTARLLTGGGAGVLVLGVVLVLAFPVAGDWVLFPLVAPLVLGCGAALAAYGLVLAGHVPTGDGEEALPARAADPVRTVEVLLVLTVVAALFWATATIAQWAGYTQASDLAADLTVLPAVVLDTEQRLQLGDDVVAQTALRADDGDRFRFRYTGLRLLAEGDGTLFLVPERWTDDGSTLVVPVADVRFRIPFPG